MAWSGILTRWHDGAIIGFAYNPYVPNPLQDYVVSGGSTNPTLSQFNGAFEVAVEAVNLSGGTSEIWLDDTHWLQCVRIGNNYAFSTNLPDSSSASLTSSVMNNLYWGFFVDDENQVATLGFYRWATPTDYSSAWTNMTRGAASHDMWVILNNLVPPLPPTDPYAPGGISEPQEPQGTFDDVSDEISLPSVPALNLALNNFISAYAPSLPELNDLASFIWGDYSGVDRRIAKFFADPTDAIISLHMMPFSPSTSSAIEVTIGRYGSSVTMPPITRQFEDVDCGTITIDPYWDNYLDYNPYTRLTLALPYVGEVQLDPDEVMGQAVNVLYRCDVLSGAFVCFISVPDKILAQYSGNCSLSVPISSASYAQANAAIMQLAVSAVGLGSAAVGYSAAMEAGAGKEIASAGAHAGEASSAAGSSAMSVLNAKVNHSHSGNIAGVAGFLGRQKPYLLIHRARQSVPEDANAYHGYPCNVTMVLSDLTGFTMIKHVIMDDLPFTREEINDLRAILAAGIYV